MEYRILASTGDTFAPVSFFKTWKAEDLKHKSLQETTPDYQYPSLSMPIYNPRSAEAAGLQYNVPNITRSLDWAVDGSSIVTTNEDFGIRLYMLPPNILDSEVSDLVPFTRIFQPSSILAHSVNPDYSIYADGDLNNTILVSLKGLPLKLISLIPDDLGKNQVISHYKLENLNNETYYNVNCITHLNDSTFAAGSNNKFAIFNVERVQPTVVSDFKKLGLIAEISEASINSINDSCIYLGSNNNEVCVWDRNSNQVVHKSLLSTKVLPPDNVGTGITQLIESRNGNYLFSLSRNSKHINVLDIRMNLKPIASLQNWLDKKTNQRITCDLSKDNKGLICGSSNGIVKIWRDAESGKDCEADVLFHVKSNDAVPAVNFNPDFSMMALSCGERRVDDFDDNTLGLYVYSTEPKMKNT